MNETLDRVIGILRDNQHLYTNWVYHQQELDGTCKYCVMGLIAEKLPELGITLNSDACLVTAEPILRKSLGLTDQFSILHLVDCNDHSVDGNYNDALDYLLACVQSQVLQPQTARGVTGEEPKGEIEQR